MLGRFCGVKKAVFWVVFSGVEVRLFQGWEGGRFGVGRSVFLGCGCEGCGCVSCILFNLAGHLLYHAWCLPAQFGHFACVVPPCLCLSKHN